jgi:hypothetical protein
VELEKHVSSLTNLLSNDETERMAYQVAMMASQSLMLAALKHLAEKVDPAAPAAPPIPAAPAMPDPPDPP